MSDVYFNKNAGAPKNASSPKKPVRKKDDYEDISSYSRPNRDEYEDISSTSHRGECPQHPVGKRKPSGNNGGPSNKPPKKGHGKKNDEVDISSKSKKGKNKALKIILAIFLVILIIGGIAMAVVYNMLGKMKYNEPDSGEPERVNPYISADQLYSDPNVTNILLLGVDAREGETVSRSDTMMLVSLDKTHKKIKMTSFLRDSYVEIPGSGWNKLNASATKGGEEMVMNTIEYNYKIKIDHYMLVDFVAFEKLIDEIGGVDVEVKEKEANYLNNTWAKWSLTGNPLTFQSGESVHLNGEEALMFCRIRKLDSDFYRTERQRRVISAVKTKVMASPTKITGIANAVFPLVETDIPRNKMMSLCMGAITTYIKYDMAQQAIPADGTWHSESKKCGDSLVFDIDENSKILKDFIYNDIYEGNETVSTTAVTK